MSSYRYIHTTDWHLTDKSVSSRIDDVSKAQLKKLDSLFKIAEGSVIRDVYISGDLFDYPNIRSNSFIAAVMRKLQSARERGFNFYAIPGNHDISWKMLDTYKINSFGLFLASGIIELIGERMVWDGLKLKGILPYQPLADQVNGVDPEVQVVFVHGYMVKRDYMDDLTYSIEELESYFPNLQIIHFGHDHSHTLVADGDVDLVNPGALSRMSIARENIDRELGVYVVDLGSVVSRKYEFRKLDYSPAEQVFRVEQRQVDKEVEENVGKFVSDIHGMQADANSSVEGYIAKSVEKIEDREVREYVRNRYREIGLVGG